MGRFTDKVVIVTGGARGIGGAAASAFAAEGARVVVNDIVDPEPMVAELRAQGAKAIAALGDVSDYAAVERVVQRAVDAFGRLDIMVANAAYSERGPFWEIPLASFRRTIDVTMMGPYHCLLAATRAMKAQRPMGGTIVVTGSPHAQHAFPGALAYNMAKAAITHMARTAACELFPHKIRVNVMHPGWTDTPGERKFKSDAELAAIGRAIPPGRLARSEEIARGILFLADDASEYMNGAELSMDGGLNLPWVPWDEWLAKGTFPKS